MNILIWLDSKSTCFKLLDVMDFVLLLSSMKGFVVYLFMESLAYMCFASVIVYPCVCVCFFSSKDNLREKKKLQGVAITQENSLLDNTARIEGWLARFPMFDWVGGRTSEMSAVGLLPAALQV